MNRGQKLWVTVTLWVVIIGFAAGGVLFFTPGGPTGLFGNNTQDQQQQQPAITVNGEEISTSELDTRLQQTIQRYDQISRQYGAQLLSFQLSGPCSQMVQASNSQRAAFSQLLNGALGSQCRMDLRNQAAEQLIRETLITQEADERGVSAPQTQVDEQFRQQYQQLLNSNGITEEQLRQRLQQNPQLQQQFQRQFGSPTVEALKGYLRSQVRDQLKQEQLRSEVVGEVNPTTADLLSYVENNRQQFLSQIIKPVVPSEDELRSYFEENQDQYGQEQVNARHILIELPQSPSQEVVQSAEEQIAEVQRQLDDGADFAEMARQYSDGPSGSDGGDLGWFGQGQMVAPFEEAAFALEEGEISEPVRTEFGFHLIKLEGRRTQGFEDSRDQIRQDYVSSVQDERFQSWLSEARESGEFPQQPEAHVRQIQVNLPSDPSEEQVQSAERQIQSVQEQLQSEDADFAALAQEHSDGSNAGSGGDLGWITYGASQPNELKLKAFELDAGQTSEPFRTDAGFHIIKVEETRTTDSLKQQVTDAYTQQEQQERFDQWVEEQKDAADIVVEEPLLAAYRLAQRADEADENAAKLDRLDQGIAAYDEAGANVANDPHIGYYQSQLYQQKASILQSRLDNLGEDASEQARQSLQERLSQAQQNAVDAFLASVGNYRPSDQSAFQSIVDLASGNADVHYYYAQFLNNTVGNASRALEQINRALEIDADYAQAHQLAAGIHRNQGNFAQAVEHLEQAGQLVEPGSSNWRDIEISRAQTYLEQAESTGNDEPIAQARDVLLNLRDQLNTSDRRYGEVQTLIGDLHMDDEAYADAIEAYNGALEAGVNSPMDVEIKLGEAQMQAGRVDAAVSTLESVVNRSAGQYSAPAHVNLADAYRAQGNTEDALSEYRRALELRANQSLQIEIARKILELDPSDQDTRFQLASLYRNAGQHSNAMEQYRTILENSPENWRAQRGMGEAQLALNRPEEAKNHLKSALLQEPSPSDQISIYQSLLEADRAINGEGSLGEDGKDALLQLADLYLSQGQTSQAQQRLQTLQDNYPDYRPDRIAELQSELDSQSSQGQDSSAPGQPSNDDGSSMGEGQ